MKVFVLLGLVSLALAAPQPRKIFHEHFFDFITLIFDEAGHELEHIMEHYQEFDEFRATFEYLQTANFKDLAYEMESLPEFNAVVDFLENDNIDIHYFIDLVNDMIENGPPTGPPRKSRHEISGTDFASYIQDIIAAFPKEKLAALYEQKVEEDEEFKVTMENLKSDEWQQVFTALLESENFKKEVEILEQNGIYINLIFDEITAVFGLN